MASHHHPASGFPMWINNVYLSLIIMSPLLPPRRTSSRDSGCSRARFSSIPLKLLLYNIFFPFLSLCFPFSTRSILHKEPEGRALLAENPAANGGDGVADQRGDPQRCATRKAPHARTTQIKTPYAFVEFAIEAQISTDGLVAGLESSEKVLFAVTDVVFVESEVGGKCHS